MTLRTHFSSTCSAEKKYLQARYFNQSECKAMRRKTPRTSRKTGKTARMPWGSKDVAELKRRIKAREHARDIGKAMGRTEGAIRQKAFSSGLKMQARRSV